MSVSSFESTGRFPANTGDKATAALSSNAIALSLAGQAEEWQSQYTEYTKEGEMNDEYASLLNEIGKFRDTLKSKIEDTLESAIEESRRPALSNRTTKSEPASGTEGGGTADKGEAKAIDWMATYDRFEALPVWKAYVNNPDCYPENGFELLKTFQRYDKKLGTVDKLETEQVERMVRACFAAKNDLKTSLGKASPFISKGAYYILLELIQGHAATDAKGDQPDES